MALGLGGFIAAMIGAAGAGIASGTAQRKLREEAEAKQFAMKLNFQALQQMASSGQPISEALLQEMKIPKNARPGLMVWADAMAQQRQQKMALFQQFIQGGLGGEQPQAQQPAALPPASPSQALPALSGAAPAVAPQGPPQVAPQQPPGEALPLPHQMTPALAEQQQGRPLSPAPTPVQPMTPVAPQPQAAPAPQQAPAQAAPQPQGLPQDATLDRLVAAGRATPGRQTSATMGMTFEGMSVSRTRPAETSDDRGRRVLREAVTLNAPVRTLVKALALSEASVPEKALTGYINARVMATFNAKRQELAQTQGLRGRALETAAAQAAVEEHGVPGPLPTSLLYADKDSERQDFWTFGAEMLARGLTPSEAVELAAKTGFRVDPDARKAFMQQSFSKAFDGAYARRIGQGMDQNAAANEAAQEAMMLTGSEGVSQSHPAAKILFPDLPPLRQDVEGELRVEGTTAARATPQQIGAAQERARHQEVVQEARKAAATTIARGEAEQKLPVTPQEAQATGVPMGTRREQTAGLFALTPAERKDIGQFSSVHSVIGQLEGLSKRIHTGVGPGLRPFAGAARRLGEITQTDPDAVAYNRLRQATISVFSRVVGMERGMLAEGDIRRAEQFLPKLTDTEQVAREGFQRFRQLVQEIEEAQTATRGPLRTPGPPPQRPDARGRIERRPDGTFHYVPGGK